MSNVLSSRIVAPYSKRLCSFNHGKCSLSRRFYSRRTNFNGRNGSQLGWFAVIGAFVTGSGAIYFKSKQLSLHRTPFVLSAASNEEDAPEVQTELTVKQMKFEEYASYEYGGKQLMSPEDFLNSLVDNKGSFINLWKIYQKFLDWFTHGLVCTCDEI